MAREQQEHRNQYQHFQTCNPHIFPRHLSVSYLGLIFLFDILCSDRSFSNLMAALSRFRQLLVKVLSSCAAVALRKTWSIRGSCRNCVPKAFLARQASPQASAASISCWYPAAPVIMMPLSQPADSLVSTCVAFSFTPLLPVFLSYLDGLCHRHSSSEIGKCQPCQR